jgi:hypothetical protein
MKCWFFALKLGGVFLLCSSLKIASLQYFLSRETLCVPVVREAVDGDAMSVIRRERGRVGEPEAGVLQKRT